MREREREREWERELCIFFWYPYNSFSLPLVFLYVKELRSMCTGAMSAVEARNVSAVFFNDCSDGSIGAIMGMMECELSPVQRGAGSLCDSAREGSERS